MIGFIIRILGNALAVYIAVRFVPGFIVGGSIREFLLAGALLGLLNMTVRPFLRLISMPVIILSLGLFAIVINALMLWVVDFIFDFVKIQDTWALIWATIVVGIVNLLVSMVTKSID